MRACVGGSIARPHDGWLACQLLNAHWTRTRTVQTAVNSTQPNTKHKTNTNTGKRIYVPDRTLEHMVSHPEVQFHITIE